MASPSLGQTNKIQDCLTIKSTTNLPLPFLKEKGRNNYSEHFCALSPEDMIKLFGRAHATPDDYIYASDRMYSVVCLEGFESGTAGFSSNDEKEVNTCNYSKLTTLCRVTEQSFRSAVLKEATVTLVLDHNGEVNIANKKLFKTSIVAALKPRLFEKKDSFPFEYANHQFRLNFDYDSNLKSVMISDTTKLRLRKKEAENIIFRDNILKLSNHAVVNFYISMPTSSSGQLHKSQFTQFIKAFLPNGTTLYSLNNEMREVYNTIQYRIKVTSIQDLGKTYKYNKIAQYKIPDNYKFEYSFESGIKLVDDPVIPPAIKEAVKSETVAEVLKPEAKIEPIEAIKKISFGEFLESKGLFGITPEMIKEIEVVLDYYGPERVDLDAFGIYPTKALLFFGEPGNGKTKVVEQIAAFLKIPDANYTKVTASDLLGGIVGSTEANIREVFAKAEKEAKDKGDKSSLHLIFFDEIDALGMSRDSATQSHEVSKVTALLGKIDGVADCKNVLVIASTNCKDKLDPSLKREGRFSLVEFKNPNEALRLTLFKHYLSSPTKRYKEGFNFELVAKVSEGLSAADIKGMANKARFEGYERAKKAKIQMKLTSSEMSNHESGFVSEEDILPLIKKLRVDKNIVLNEIISSLIEEKLKENLKKQEEEEKLEAKRKEREKEALHSIYN